MTPPTDEKIYELLLPLWAANEVYSHVPYDIDGGPTCDERGCAICNLGDEFIEYVVSSQQYKRDGMGHLLPSVYFPDLDLVIEGAQEFMAGQVGE